MSNIPLVSIIIVNYNGKELLEKCLESLSKIYFKDFEVILVDNNSTDSSLEYVSKNYPSIIIIKLNSNKGFAEPNNIGSKIAKGKYLLFLNNDTIVTENFLSELINTMEKETNIAICQSLLLKLDGSVDSSGDFIDELGVVYSSKILPNNTRPISSAKAASMLVKKDFFENIGGFDDKFFATFEDVDLGWRAWIAGYKVVLNPNSIVYHLGGKTIESIKKEIAFHGFKNQLSMKITNFEPPLVIRNMFLFFIIYGYREFRIWLDYTLKGFTKLTSTEYEDKIAEKPSLTIILKSFFWIFQNSGYLLIKQKQINHSRKCSTKTLMKMNIIGTNFNK